MKYTEVSSLVSHSKGPKSENLGFFMKRTPVLLLFQQTCRHLVYYKMVNRDKEHGLELYMELPQIRQKFVDTVRNSNP